MRMTVRGDEIGDWTYRAARQRMVRVARTQIARHAAIPQLDDHGNRVVKCGCGWCGNALGWADHLDAVVHSALDTETAP
jgi:aconitase A